MAKKIGEASGEDRKAKVLRKEDKKRRREKESRKDLRKSSKSKNDSGATDGDVFSRTERDAAKAIGFEIDERPVATKEKRLRHVNVEKAIAGSANMFDRHDQRRKFQVAEAAAQHKRAIALMLDDDHLEGGIEGSDDDGKDVNYKSLRQVVVRSHASERLKKLTRPIRFPLESHELKTAQPCLHTLTRDGRFALVARPTGKFALFDLHETVETKSKMVVTKISGKRRAERNQLTTTHNVELTIRQPSRGFTDQRGFKTLVESHIQREIFDIQFLSDYNHFAIAHARGLELYDSDGLSIFEFGNIISPRHVRFLPYHFLMAVGDATGGIFFHDVSTGKLLNNEKRLTKVDHGGFSAFEVNQQNGITLTAARRKQVVQMWNPIMPEPIVTLGVGDVAAMSFDLGGTKMITGSNSGTVKVFDLRKLYRNKADSATPVLELKIGAGNVQFLDVSGKDNVVATGGREYVQTWEGLLLKSASDIKGPTLQHRLERNSQGHCIGSLGFRPFEDQLLFGSLHGVVNLLVPGSGIATLDTRTAALNPYATKKQRADSLVHRLLEKLCPETISTNPNFIGSYAGKEANIASISSSSEESGSD